MLSKNVDHAVVGHNFFAYFFSHLLLERKQSVMLLDDERFNFGDFYTETLTEFDQTLLKKIGEIYKIESFINIENYLTKKEHFFFLGKKRVLLGGSFLDNLRELKRKFPEFFNSSHDLESETYEQECLDYLNKAAQRIFDDSNWNSKRPFDLTSNVALVKNFRSLNSLLQGQSLEFRQKNELFTLVNMTRGFYQGILSTRGTEAELFHAFVCLLSPLYELDHERLKNNLKEEFEKRGGEFKKLNLGEFKLQSGAMQSFMLESFEGHIKAKKMSFIGGSIRDLPLIIKVPGKKFSCLKAKVLYQNVDKDYLNKFFIGQNILFSSVLKVGTDRPFWFGSFLEDHFEVTFIVAEKSGTKETFFHGPLESLINEDFGFIYPELEGSLKLQDLRFSHDHLIEDRQFKFSGKLSKLIPDRMLKIFDRAGPHYLDALKNVYYYGPFTNDRLGTYSSLLLLKKIGPKI